MTIRQLTCLRMFLAANLLSMGERSLLADERDEFFEARIRPVLVEQCYQCHNSAKTAEGGLAIDQRAATLTGGDVNFRAFLLDMMQTNCRGLLLDAEGLIQEPNSPPDLTGSKNDR